VPLYEYECRACGHRFERIQTYSDPIVRKCPKCKKSKVKRLPSAPAVQFKGSGWYVTDYGRKGSGAAPPDRSDGEKAASEKDSGKRSDEKKPDEKKAGAGKEGAAKEPAARKGGRKE
jgi:putative FmdB family regulatory protein